MLSWLAVDAERASIQGDLERRSRAALVAEGYEWASVAFDGRDGLIVGQAAGEGERQRAVEVVRGVWGVGSVRTRGSATAIADAPIGSATAAAAPSTLGDVSPAVIGDLPPSPATRVNVAQAAAMAYLPPIVHVPARDVGAIAAAGPDSAPDSADKRRSAEPAKETVLAATADRGEHGSASPSATATGGEGAPAAKSLPSAELGTVSTPQQKAAEPPPPPPPQRKDVVVGAAVARAEPHGALAHRATGLTGTAAPAPRPPAAAPPPRFETAALPPSNIASEATCISDVKGAAQRVEVHFGHGDARLDAPGKAVIDGLVAALGACPDVSLQVAGHADASGLARRNEVLSRQRARVVAGYLVDKGIDAGRLVAVGYGDKRPVAPNDTQANRAKNRRIELTVAARKAPLPPMPVRKQGTRNGLSDR